MRFLLIPAFLALAACAPATTAIQPAPPAPLRMATGPGVPHFFAKPEIGFTLPDRTDLVNINGTERVHRDEDYQRFQSEIAPRLLEWARDPRLALNPAYVAALLAKESGFEPFATSFVPANGYPQMTHIADADLRQIARDSPRFAWMREELERWPRHPLVHRSDATKAVTDSLTTAGEIHPGNEYLFDPHSATRGAVFWLRVLAEIWMTDDYPGRYGAFARDALRDGGPLTELDVLELVTVSYNRGYPYVEDLVRRYGADWVGHVDEEAADHLERIKVYTVLFQR